jgi:hypothetical protein
MITYTFRRVREHPAQHPSSDHWTCSICGRPCALHGARLGWISSTQSLPPTCCAAHQAQAAALLMRGAVFTEVTE